MAERQSYLLHQIRIKIKHPTFLVATKVKIFFWMIIQETGKIVLDQIFN
jgi:hypothetical protein